MNDSSRRALSNQGGRVQTRGDAQEADWLAKALAKSKHDPDSLTHGFHSYAAKMHPRIAGAVLDHLREGAVLDPFCGSGTTIVEARVRGRTIVGTDLDPIGLRLSQLKSSVVPEPARQRFLATAEGVAERSEERVRTRQRAMADLDADERSYYDVHVLKEMAGLFEEIAAVPHKLDRGALELVFSANVIKLSRQVADTSWRTTDKRLRKGLVTEFFLRKAQELAQRWQQLAKLADPQAPRPILLEADAQKLPQALSDLLRDRLAGERFSLVLSSPPYGGTYNYFDHHARRRAWLKIGANALHQHEIGARRRLQSDADLPRWNREMEQTLQSIAKVTAPGGAIVLVVGDAQIGSHRIDADEQLQTLSARAKLQWIASANQPRTDYQGQAEPRREHLVLLRR